jgi:uncharacterized protein (TIGR02996 family)
MNSEAQWGLWTAIRNAPLDDIPRLIYADWLDEHGDPERAELIRIQCTQCAEAQKHPFGNLPEKHEWAKFDARAKALIDAHGDRWLANVRRVLKGSTGDDQWLERLRFRRGFLDAQPFPLESIHRLARAEGSVEPPDRIWFAEQSANGKQECLIEIGQWQGARSVLGISISGASDSDIDAIVASAHYCNLVNLAVWGGKVSDAGIAQLVEWPHSAGLRTIDLKDTKITVTAALALAKSPNLASICFLDVSGTPIGAKGYDQLKKRFGNALKYTVPPVL